MARSLPQCAARYAIPSWNRFFDRRIRWPGSKLRAVILALLLLVSTASPADVAGNWRVAFVVPSGEMAVNMTINQNGSKLSGRVVNEDGEFPLDGSVDGNEVTVTWVVPEQGTQMTITMKGTIDGEYITGTARLGGVGEG